MAKEDTTKKTDAKNLHKSGNKKTNDSVKDMKSNKSGQVFDAYSIVKFPVSTEKNVRLMESENKLLFVVDDRASKSDVKRAIEEMFKVKVVKVNSHFGADGQKRMFVTFSVETPAIDIATNLGLI